MSVTVYRLLCDPPADLSDSFYGMPRKGGLVFHTQGFGKVRRLTASPGGYGRPFDVPDEQLERYQFGQPQASDFPELLRYYLAGKAMLPNFEQLPVERGLDAIAAGGGLAEPKGGIQNVLLPGESYTTWARVFLSFTQGGKPDGSGYAIWYRGSMKRGPEGSQVAHFTLCPHTKVQGAGANPNRGWHPGSCSKCGLDMTVDSSD